MPKEQPFINPHMKSRSRTLRREAPIPERILWGMLRGRCLAGLKFRRQYVVGPYVVDYYCDEARLVVELDGMSHIGQGERDDERTAYLGQKGFRVLRITNDDLLQAPHAVAEAIVRAAGVNWTPGTKPSP